MFVVHPLDLSAAWRENYELIDWAEFNVSTNTIIRAIVM